LRRAMGSKNPEEMAKQRAVFVNGAVNRGITEAHAGGLFDLMEKFAGYGFNKSHSAAYALVSYQTAAGDWKQKIGTQMWIALYNRGFEAWTQWRLLDYPQLVAPPDAESDNGLPPLRYPYPISEQTLNGANWAAASALLPGGEDVMEAKLFWDKN